MSTTSSSVSTASMSDVEVEPSQCSRRILLMAIGSMGDVLPFINLGIGFQSRGHVVMVAANSRFRDLIESKGFEFREITWDMQYEWENTEAGKRMVKYSSNTILGPPSMFSFLKQGFQKSYKDSETVLTGVDFVLLGTGSNYMYPECVVRKIPVACIYFYPYASTKNYAGAIYGRPFDSLQWLPFELNFKIWKTVDSVATLWSDVGLLPIYNQRCQELGLPTVERLPWLPGGAIETEQIPVLHASNKHLINIPPNPKNPRERQFDYPFLNIKEELKDFEPPQDLDNFLKKGRKPIYFGYGSMHSFGDTEGRVRLWLDVMKKLPKNQRAIFAGISGVENSELTEGIQNKKIHVVNHVPHSWLFPKVACVVHHGGAGTTHAVVRAGVPSIVVPHFADQPWWASLLYRHGLTINSGIPVKSITSDRLYRALLDVLTDEDVIDKASVFGARIRKDQKRDPVTKIVKYIEGYWDSLHWDTLSLEDEKSYASSESF